MKLTLSILLPLVSAADIYFYPPSSGITQGDCATFPAIIHYNAVPNQCYNSPAGYAGAKLFPVPNVYEMGSMDTFREENCVNRSFNLRALWCAPSLPVRSAKYLPNPYPSSKRSATARLDECISAPNAAVYLDENGEKVFVEVPAERADEAVKAVLEGDAEVLKGFEVHRELK
ncbi:hypothetical protein BJ508DRAFT_414469 [Ascobolus immersus RN42]|uniref:Uncharacterized protein n=1 Tax=Ascobolus immersus RN42 TaxID=1160509 RepID=A0A3N4ICQ5_ASCIM|nr:hypothetical protein BJ508DRAFT_414469 [Ascobolus immersus RN42]